MTHKITHEITHFGMQKMTRDEVIDMLTDKGFTVKRTEITDEDIVIHRGEQVACIYDNYVSIAKHYPSLNPDGVSTSYADADKFVIMFSHPISEVDTAIQWLLYGRTMLC